MDLAIVICFRRMNRTQVIFGILIVLVLAISAVWQFKGRTAAVPPETVSEQPTLEINKPASLDVTAVSVTPATSHPVQASFALVEGDRVASWDFKGAYTDNPELVAKAQAEINRLSGLLETATSSAMVLSVGVANQYELLGDGKKQYEYLGRAIRTNPENGLPWHNLGVLMERLGALETARIAYKEATVLQPELAVYHYAYLEFLIVHMKHNTTDIEKAFAAAERSIGKKQSLIDLRAQWQTP